MNRCSHEAMGLTEQIPRAGTGCYIAPEAAGHAVSPVNRHTFFMAAWYALNILLIVSVLMAAYCIAWEYSTRIYLKGFSDAVIPASLSPEAKIEAILNWMAHGPARQQNSSISPSEERDPTDTLNYASLLHVCGTATNAFINLADSGGLEARRLLLLDPHRSTKHVVAEVFVEGRWIVVDPLYRTILRSADGELLSREDLADPTVFSAATARIPGYNPSYTFEHTAHVHLSRLQFIGHSLRQVLDHSVPGWEDSAMVSLLLERESFAAMVLSIILVMFLGLSRASLRWYAETRLGLRPKRFIQSMQRAGHAFLGAAG
jgi:hypothetical protein